MSFYYLFFILFTYPFYIFSLLLLYYFYDSISPQY